MHRPAPTAIWSLILATAVAAAAAVLGGAVRAAAPAGAEVRHGAGFRATVDGWTAWYGTFEVAPLGPVLSVDHAAAPPDGALLYVPVSLDLGAEESTQLAWLLGAAAPAFGDPVTASAAALAVQDLRRARFPAGRLDIDALDPRQLSGFDGHEAAVLARARSMKADAIAHRALRSPLRLEIEPAQPGVGERWVRLLDAAGQPITGIAITVPSDPTVAAVATDRTGRAAVRWPPTSRLVVEAAVPSLRLRAFAPSNRRAQRVALGGTEVLRAEAPPRDVPPVPHPTGRLAVVMLDAAGRVVSGGRLAVDLLRDGVPVGRPAIVDVPGDGPLQPLVLPPGSYRVTELRPPAGCDDSGPWRVTVERDTGVVLRLVHPCGQVPGSSVPPTYTPRPEATTTTNAPDAPPSSSPPVATSVPALTSTTTAPAATGPTPSPVATSRALPGRPAALAIRDQVTAAEATAAQAAGEPAGAARPAEPARARLPATGFPVVAVLGIGVGVLVAGVGMVLAAGAPAHPLPPPSLDRSGGAVRRQRE